MELKALLYCLYNLEYQVLTISCVCRRAQKINQRIVYLQWQMYRIRDGITLLSSRHVNYFFTCLYYYATYIHYKPFYTIYIYMKGDRPIQKIQVRYFTFNDSISPRRIVLTVGRYRYVDPGTCRKVTTTPEQYSCPTHELPSI